jgi:hypothetical protein
MSIDPIILAGYGDTPSDLYDLSKKWGMSPDRLKFLSRCPSGIHRNWLKDQKTWTPEEKRIAGQCRLAYRQNFTAHEAAEMAKVKLEVVNAFLEKVGATWPAGCRRKLAWGGGSTLNARREGGNLLAPNVKATPKRKTADSVEQTLLQARACGLSLKEAAAKSGIPYQTLYAACRRLGLVIAKVYRPRTVKGKVRL